jgi:primosomal protein N' (replication factor Y)
LGLIVVDEEHESGYQEKRHPKINTKEAALLRARQCNIPILMGSATPSIQSLFNVQHRDWKLFEITKRFSGSFPQMQVVSLKNQYKRPYWWLSRELEVALTKKLAAGEQSIIFINRRGFSFFVQCAACGHICTCANCSVSLTLHEDGTMRCHYCNALAPEPKICPACTSPQLLKKGLGTQQVVAVLAKLFPQARIARADLDVTTNKKRWSETVGAMHARQIDILVGTQTITKGYHFPGVTLVGIVWADINLSLPAYNAAELTLQQLIQVAGRAGRATAESTVIVQTVLEHPLYQFLDERTYRAFYDYEIAYREKLRYPPYVRLAEIELRHPDEQQVLKDANACALLLRQAARQQGIQATLLGPAQPPVHKIRNTCLQRIYLKTATVQELHLLYAALANHPFTAHLSFTPNPQQ